MENEASEKQILAVQEKIEKMGFKVHRSDGEERTVLGVVGEKKANGDEKGVLELSPGVREVLSITKSYKLTSREWHNEDTIINVRGTEIGGDKIAIIAGPCAVETKKLIFESAELLKEAGVGILRGGAFKPRTSPYSFQGLGEEGLRYMREAGDEHNLAVVSEVMDVSQIEMMSKYVDMFQVGARNMQNFWLLKELGKTKKPIVLKRGMSATIEEWLMAAEYIMSGGNYQIILCERGIRTFENYTRNTLDISAIPVIQKLSHLPVIVDPSHATGRRDKVSSMARASVAAGSHGLMIEMHPNPETALSDGAQSLYPKQFIELVDNLKIIASAVGKTI